MSGSSSSPSQSHAVREPIWTVRQREVLDLLVRGRTNPEIAQALGISLDGAKWHVSEVITKLGVDSRDEAAEYWRAHNGLRPRFTRMLQALIASTWLKVGAGVAVVAGASIVVAVVIIARNGSGTSPGSAVATPILHVPVIGLTGVFEEPRATVPDRVVTPPAAPPSPFSPWDGKSTVIYDVKTGKETNLGPGGVPSFSPDGTRAIWIAADPADVLFVGEARLIDLTTGTVKSLGPAQGFYPQFLDNNTVAFSLPGADNRAVSVDLRSGVQTDISGNDIQARAFERLDALRETTPDGYRVSWQPDPSAPPLPRGAAASEKVVVTDTHSGQLKLAFDAFAAAPAGKGYVVVASKPNGQTVNLFLVDVASGQAQFVATTRWSGNFPLVADDNRVVWIDNFCGDPPGNLEVYDRATKQLTEVSGVHDDVGLTPSGQLALGGFGARSLMDPATFGTVVSLPAVAPLSGASDVSWSDDYRYAAHGVTGGHGGLC